MILPTKKLKSSRLYRSRKALAIPITFLILFVSTLALISVTYAFAVQRVTTQSQDIKVLTAEQSMISLDDNILSVASQPGSARSFDLPDSGGQIGIQPDTNNLAINITDNNEISANIFNETVGQVTYELPSSYSSSIGFYMKGDSRTIVNQSGALMTQLSIQDGIEQPEIQLGYRPIVSYTAEDGQGNEIVNNLRIYVVNLNTSDSLSMYGEIPFRISCESIQVASQTFNVNYQLEELQVTSTINGSSGEVSIPISSAPDGAVVNVEIVQCNIKIERSLV